MSWEWSHTAEAYENARVNLHRMHPTTLRAIWAEWEAFEPTDARWPFASSSTSQFSESKHAEALKRAKSLPKDVLADTIWDRMSEQRACTNGGWLAHCCPFGCGCHMVSFSTWAEQMREARERKRKQQQTLKG